jgi:hypothetical protein
MKRLTVVIPLLVLTILSATAQKASVRGTVVDTSNKDNLPNAVVSLLRAKDSILYKFTRTDKQGRFSMGQLSAGNFILLVTYPKYADFVEPVVLTDTSTLDLGKINVILKASLLAEVVVRQKVAAIKIKGDTTEYAADSFRVQPNATVEELLKKLPGLQVDKNGKITAQGETVQKVLVDGEEFFGDDPTLVTQNLRADMVDKVQVFDKKSDQAAFTGIDDGEKTKTINLKLKDNKKNGYFGKVNAGAGTEHYYDTQLMFNYFKKKQKFSAYGIMSNTGKTGLNWQERDNYGQSIAGSLDFDEASGYYMYSGDNDELDSWSGQYNGQGYPSVKTGGLHYNNKWNDDKQAINANYKHMFLEVNGASTTNSQFLGDSSYYQNQSQRFYNQIKRHRADAIYDLQFDSTSSIKITANGGIDNKVTFNHQESEAITTDSMPINKSVRDLNTTSESKSFNSSLLWRKKLRKKGRTISLSLQESYEKSLSEGYLFADNSFFKNGNTVRNDVTDQYKDYSSEKLFLDSKITYSEPLSAVSSIIANYGISVNNSTSGRNSFNKSSNGKYTDLDTLFSNDYQFNVFTQRAGAVYNLIKKKLRFNAGTNVGFTSFHQTDTRADTTAKRNFVNWFPQASVTYSFTSQKRLSLRYNGSTTQPSIQQIQPIRNNDDGLNIAIGNPALKPQFSNNLGVNFNDYKVLTDRWIYANVNYRFTQNAISNSDSVSAGQRFTRFVNLDGNNNLNGSFGYGFKLKKLGMNIGLNGNVGQSRYVNIVNGQQNITNSGNYGFGFDLYKSKEKKFDFSLSAFANYTNSKSTIQRSIATKYWTYEARFDGNIFLPLKFQIHGDVVYNIRQRTTAFDNNTNVAFVNGWVGKKFLPKDQLLLKVSVYDALNQNIGFNRTVNSNFISQNTYTTIQRYFMVTLVWNFTKAGTPAPQNQ